MDPSYGYGYGTGASGYVRCLSIVRADDRLTAKAPRVGDGLVLVPFFPSRWLAPLGWRDGEGCVGVCG